MELTEINLFSIKFPDRYTYRNIYQDKLKSYVESNPKFTGAKECGTHFFIRTTAPKIKETTLDNLLTELRAALGIEKIEYRIAKDELILNIG